jgi:hypothetical protein
MGNPNPEDTPLQYEDQPTHMRVTFDKRQIWEPKVKNAEHKAQSKLALITKLPDIKWAGDDNLLKKVYQGAIILHLDYINKVIATKVRLGSNPSTQNNNSTRIGRGGL